MQVNAKCTNCGENILIDDNKEANICPNCNNAFITEKAIKLYNAESEEAKEKEICKTKRRHVLKSLGMALWFIIKSIGYLIYVVCCLWLFFDIVDGIKKK